MKLFYVANKNILALLNENLADFAAHKASYKQSLVDDLLAKLQAADELPATSTKIANRALKRIALKAANDVVRLKGQSLKTYIEAAFSEIEWEQQLREAGFNYYVSSDVNWGATREFAKAVTLYVTDNDTALKANENMPAGFLAAFTSDANAFNAALDSFNGSLDVKRHARNAKINANNSVYEDIVSISKDAAVIYKKNEEKRKSFAYSFQLAVLQGGSASLRGWLQTPDGTPLEGVTVTCATEPTWTGVSNAEGFFKLTKLREGTDWIFKFEKPGFNGVDITVTLKAATSKTVKLMMEPVAADEQLKTDMKAAA